MTPRLGLPPASEVSARDQAIYLQGGGEAFAALPPRPEGPLTVTSEALGIAQEEHAGRTLHVIGDSGGVKDPHPQLAVAAAMAADLEQHPEVGFCWHVGDVDYFEGQRSEYPSQFFEAYVHYQRHILGIPGNHDGAGDDQLASFMRYFCDPSGPQLLPEVAEYGRDTIAQPYCFWGLLDPAITIVGLYSNVPSGGKLELDQLEWAADTLKAAPEGVPLAVSVHHPPFSVDAHHGGSAGIWEALLSVFRMAERYPALILAGHVHDYQRFTVKADGHTMTSIVQGNSGYHNLHQFAGDAKAGEEVAEGVVFEAGDDQEYGFLRLQVLADAPVGERIQGEQIKVSLTAGLDVGDSFAIA